VPESQQTSNRFLREEGRNGRWPCGLRRRALCAAVLGVCGLLTTACDRGEHPALIGSPAPAFAVTDGAQTVRLDALRGHVVILNFWATWCIPCIEEVPTLVDLQRRMPQVSVVAISSDEDAAVYRQFLTDNRVDFLTVRDPSYRVTHLYGTIKIPESYVIDRRGILRRKFVSAQNWTSPEIMDYLSKL
jgi:cytochrome c biogenesis protein CcmG/thiol:disulfide interchange protein DsbE